MRRTNCNLELSLYSFSDSDHDDQRQSCMEDDCSNESSNREEQQQEQKQHQQQQLTIFYSGNVCVCDVTDFQARAILSLASKEMEDKSRSTSPGSSESESPTTLPSSYPIDGSKYKTLSMKRSLQRFLQKRNHRLQATCPYNMNRRMTCRVDR